MLLCACTSSFAQDANTAATQRIGDFKDLPKQQQAMLDDLEKRTFEWFRDSENQKIGITPDHWDGSAGDGDFFASIASSGFGLTVYGIAVERGWMKRSEAVKRTLTTLRFFHDSKQNDDADATGDHGFLLSLPRYGNRQALRAEDVGGVSTIDTTLLLGGADVRRVVLRQEHER